MLREVQDEAHKFIVFFLNDDEDQSVHVEEVKQVNFYKIIRQLNLGRSVFITHRRKPQRNIGSGGGSSRRHRMIQLLSRGS